MICCFTRVLLHFGQRIFFFSYSEIGITSVNSLLHLLQMNSYVGIANLHVLFVYSPPLIMKNLKLFTSIVNRISRKPQDRPMSCNGSRPRRARLALLSLIQWLGYYNCLRPYFPPLLCLASISEALLTRDLASITPASSVDAIPPFRRSSIELSST